MGIGTAKGEDRAVRAAEIAVSSPLLEATIEGAHGVLLLVQGASDLGLHEIDDAARLVQEAVHPEANIIFGATIEDTLGDEVRITVIAAGFDGGEPTYRKFEAPAAVEVPVEQVVAAPAAEEYSVAEVAQELPTSEQLIQSETLVAAHRTAPSSNGQFGDDLDLPEFFR
jgi:cell division protein FtsZ